MSRHYDPDRVSNGESAAVHAKRMANLARANRVRISRAKVKRRLESGELSLREFVKNVPPEVRTAGVFEMLVCARGVGTKRAARIMRKARFSDSASFSWVRGPARKRLLDAIAEVPPLNRPKVDAEAEAEREKVGV